MYLFDAPESKNTFNSVLLNKCPTVTPFPSKEMLHYPDVYQPSKPVILQKTRVPNSLPMGVNYVDYEPQGTEVTQACLQTTP